MSKFHTFDIEHDSRPFSVKWDELEVGEAFDFDSSFPSERIFVKACSESYVVISSSGLYSNVATEPMKKRDLYRNSGLKSITLHFRQVY